MKKAIKTVGRFNRMDFAQVKGIVNLAIKLDMTTQALYSSLQDWEEQEELIQDPTEWKHVGEGEYMCMCCGTVHNKSSQYCPDCGNKMRVTKAAGFIQYDN